MGKEPRFSAVVQHTSPCRECPFRKEAGRGYLGDNHPQHFAVNANREAFFPCHLTMGKRTPEMQCAGRAIMWANQAKRPRNPELLVLNKDIRCVSSIREFVELHRIQITPQQLLGIEPLDEEAA